MNADSIKIECEDDGFWMVIQSNDLFEAVNEDVIRFRIQGVAVDLLSEVAREIEPWWREGQAVLASMKATGEIPGDDAYPLYDPKHPDFHENFSALHDNREEK